MTTTEPLARDMIPALLDQCRPDRYDPADKSWQKPVIDRVADEVSEREAREFLAQREVSNFEAIATKRTNKMLREYVDTGQYPVDWLDAMAWPLAIDDNERVALRAATAEDLKRFAERERRAAARDFTSRNASCEGALALADRLLEHGVTLVSELEPA